MAIKFQLREYSDEALGYWELLDYAFIIPSVILMSLRSLRSKLFKRGYYAMDCSLLGKRWALRAVIV